MLIALLYQSLLSGKHINFDSAKEKLVQQIIISP